MDIIATLKTNFNIDAESLRKNPELMSKAGISGTLIAICFSDGKVHVIMPPEEIFQIIRKNLQNLFSSKDQQNTAKNGAKTIDIEIPEQISEEVKEEIPEEVKEEIPQ